MFTKQFVIAQNALAAKAEAIGQKLQDEHGEVAGEVMVTAMMVAAAALVLTQRQALTDLAQEVVDGIGGAG